MQQTHFQITDSTQFYQSNFLEDRTSGVTYECYAAVQYTS